MGLFDIFGKKKKEESTEPKKEEKHIEYNVDEISTSFYIDRQKRYEEQNKERERQIEENMRKMKEAARQEIERKEKERQLAQKQRELEQAQRKYDIETSKQLEEFNRDVRQMTDKMQAEIDKTTKEKENYIVDISKRIEEVENSPEAKRINNVAAELATEFLETAKTEKLTKLFEEKHKKISEVSGRLTLGIIPSSFDETQKKKYIGLSNEQKDDLLIPYLIEKISLGIGDEMTKRNLNKRIRDNGKKIPEQYTSGVELLQSFGLIDITDKEVFSVSFDKCSTKSRDEIKRQSELSGMIDDKKDDSFEKGGSNTK